MHLLEQRIHNGNMRTYLEEKYPTYYPSASMQIPSMCFRFVNLQLSERNDDQFDYLQKP